MADQLLNLIITTSESFEPSFAEWIFQRFRNDAQTPTCTLEEFGIFFLNFVRQQTEEYMRTAGTPKCIDTPPSNKANVHSDASVKRTPKRVPSNNNISNSSTPEHRSKNDDSLQLQSTPKNSSTLGESFHQPHHRWNTSTPQRSFNRSNISGNSSNDFSRSSNGGLCLGDFIVTSSRSAKKKPQQKDLFADNSKLDQKTKKVEKPKKRVVPTQVTQKKADGTSSTSFSSSPAFSNENNMLKIYNDTEIIDKDKCDFMATRKSLKSNILEISREIEEENRPNLINQGLKAAVKRMEKLNGENLEVSTNERTNEAINFSKLTHRKVLDRFAEIYSFLIDVHITANVLNELSYLLGILNANNATSQNLTPQQSFDFDSQLDDKLSVINLATNEAYTALKTLTNCIYFALEVLKRQKHLLALLDVKTLRVVLNNEMISDLAVDLKEFLEKITIEKQQLEAKKSLYETSFRITKSFNNVVYQQENDTRTNFPTDVEFSCFKSQRDTFYTIFKIWEMNHLTHTWNFKLELKGKIQNLFNISDHPVNMAHLAKLFVSQLLVSSNYSETSPTDIGVELKAHVDLQKFSKLTQRLVEPSNFSMDYQFPAKQAFFRDFLMASSCPTFIEQVKLALLCELLQLNNSSFEVIHLPSDENYKFGTEYVVRPEILSTMQVLAKFVGLLQARPFTYNPTNGCSSIDKKQIELRNMLQPNFDAIDLLKVAVREKKLLITIPWIVQYLAMLDHITLQLDYYRNTLNLLYELYICLGERADILKMRPTSVFILRTCLGWFFDGANIANSYYVYRQNRTISLTQLAEMNELSILVPNSMKSEWLHGDEKQMVVMDIRKGTKGDILLTLEQFRKGEVAEFNRSSIGQKTSQFDPMLECILNVACPFLSEFRVAIMPAKYSKCVSRTGRYRHITPKITEITGANSTSSEQQAIQDNQSKLIEAFLHSQNLSVRRIIEFVIERTTSAVIKDAQIEILLPSKTEANRKVQQIESTDRVRVRKDILQIYTEANDSATAKWDADLPTMIESRVKTALDALLPHETHSAVRKTCLILILQKCQYKINDWRTTNLKGIDFYIKDVDVTVDKMVKSNIVPKKPPSINLEILSTSVCLSDILENLQFWLHSTTRRPELVEVGKIQMFLVELCKIFTNTLPLSFYRIIGSSVVHLIQNLIENHSPLVTTDLINNFIQVWNCEGMRDFQNHCYATCSKDSTEDKPPQSSTNLFSSLVTISFMRSLKTDDSFDKLELLLLNLVDNNVITIDHLNELFVRIFKVEWSKRVLNRISMLLQNVSSHKPTNEGRSKMFMEVLADFSRDIDLF